MKIAISSKEKKVASEIDARFGRCQYFVIYDTDTEAFDVVDNPGALASGGAGIETAGFIANQNINAVITGNVGPNAYTTLDAADVEIFAGVSGSIAEAVAQYKTGGLNSVQAATVASHHGTQTAPAPTKQESGKRVMITAESDAVLDAPVAHHFGRCPFYTVITVKDGSIASAESLANPFYNAHQPGQIPQFVHAQNAQVMIAGGMGARAVQFFAELGIEAVTGAAGTVRQTIDSYLSGQLSGTESCSGGKEHGLA